MQYTVDYFINKFEAIPENKWIVGEYEDLSGARCSLGHCSMIYTTKNKELFGNPYGEEQESLYNLFGDSFANHMSGTIGGGIVGNINDGKDERYQQTTPKARILAALYDVKKLQDKDTKTVIKYVAVDAEIRSTATETVLQSTTTN